MMTIGETARLSGVSAKMIRHYESLGLIQASARSDSGYRLFNGRDLHNLQFIRRARSLGFSLEQIARLLSLWQDRHRASANVKALAQNHIAELEQKISELQAMRDLLQHLCHDCHGDQRPDCPILADLEQAP